MNNLPFVDFRGGQVHPAFENFALRSQVWQFNTCHSQGVIHRGTQVPIFHLDHKLGASWSGLQHWELAIEVPLRSKSFLHDWRNCPTLTVPHFTVRIRRANAKSFDATSLEMTSAHCALCKVYFPAQLNKLRPILKIWKILSFWTHICPSLFECAENTLFKVLVIFKL